MVRGRNYDLDCSGAHCLTVGMSVERTLTADTATLATFTFSDLEYDLSVVQDDVPPWFVDNAWYRFVYAAVSGEGDCRGRPAAGRMHRVGVGLPRPGRVRGGAQRRARAPGRFGSVTRGPGQRRVRCSLSRGVLRATPRRRRRHRHPGGAGRELQRSGPGGRPAGDESVISHERPPHVRRPGRRSRRQSGFTLVELAVVIAILGLVLGTFLAPLRAQIDAARIQSTERMLGEIREALIGHAIARGALPCPDDISNGIDGAAPAACAGAALEGILPYQTLGVPRADAWGRLFRYRVTQEFSTRTLTGQPPGAGRLDLADTGDITVLTRGDDPATGATELKHQSVATALTRTAPAIVLSFGPNGLGGIGAATGVALATPPGGAADEVENADTDATFVSRVHSRGADGCDDADESTVPPPPSCEFDDIVTWISTPVLMARLVDARVLP